MGLLGDGARWCFCAGGGRSERVKAGIFSSKGPAMATVVSGGGGGGGGGGTGFLIHRGLLLTTHASVPTVAAAEVAQVQLHRGRVFARLVPHRFFITSSVLDLSIVGLDSMDPDSSLLGQTLHYLKPCCNPSLDLGSLVFLLGYTDKEELVVGEGKVVIATDNLIKLSTDGITWCPGSAGFDAEGNLAFMVCDPMKLASSPTAKSSASSASSLSWKRDSLMQFGIPIPIICDWLYQHWEGSLDELSKPKLPLIRLMSAGQKSEHSCASFTQRRVFKSSEEENDDTSLSSQIASKPRCQNGLSSSHNEIINQGENPQVDVPSTHDQGILTPEIYESPRLTSGPLWRKENTSMQLSDINFPHRNLKSIALPLPLKQLLPNPEENNAEILKHQKPLPNGADALREVPLENAERHHHVLPADSSLLDCCSEVQSSSSPVDVSELRIEEDGFSSEGETMYSAETMESRNYPSPKEKKLQQVGRSQSCVNYSRWGPNRKNSTVRKGNLQKQHSFVPGRKTNSHATALPQRSHDYFSPTVSSSMKKRNSSEQPRRPRQRDVQVSPRWLS